MELTINDKIDELELAMQEYEAIDCPLTHVFTPGLYTRTIVMPAGSLITSMIHKTRHQFIISAGTALVKVNESDWIRLTAPYVGITEPGTRRILYIEHACVWTTCHPVSIQPEDEGPEALAKAVQQVEDEIIEKHENRLLGGFIKNNVITKNLANGTR
jgi:hypothetical protein